MGNNIILPKTLTLYYILDKDTSTWSQKTWTWSSSSTPTSFDTGLVWTTKNNIYYSNGGIYHYILDTPGASWTWKSKSGWSGFTGSQVWTFKDKVYYSRGQTYVLDGSEYQWSEVIWEESTTRPSSVYGGSDYWTDGENLYYSAYTGARYEHFQLDFNTEISLDKVAETGDYCDLKNKIIVNPQIFGNEEKITSLQIENTNYKIPSLKMEDSGYVDSWGIKKWNGFSYPYLGDFIWTDGENIYYSHETLQYILDKINSR